MSTLNVYLSKYSGLNSETLHAATHDEMVRDLIVSPRDYTTGSLTGDYVLVGTAEVQITLKPRADVVAGQVAALRKQIEDERRDSGVRLLRLEQRINSLLCIEGAAQEVAGVAV